MKIKNVMQEFREDARSGWQMSQGMSLLAKQYFPGRNPVGSSETCRSDYDWYIIAAAPAIQGEKLPD